MFLHTNSPWIKSLPYTLLRWCDNLNFDKFLALSLFLTWLGLRLADTRSISVNSFPADTQVFWHLSDWTTLLSNIHILWHCCAHIPPTPLYHSALYICFCFFFLVDGFGIMYAYLMSRLHQWGQYDVLYLYNKKENFFVRK